MYGGLHVPRSLPSESALLDLGREFTPRVEARGPTPVLLDLHGLGRVWATPQALGQAIVDEARVRQLEAQVALAWSRGTALVLARGRPGLTVVPAGQESAALAPLPISLLDLEVAQSELFARWGLRTIGDLARLPASGLAERLGPDGPRLRRLARGEDDGLFVPAREPAAFEMTLELDWPVDGLEPLSFLLARVLEPLCAGLVARGRRAAALTLDLGLVDRSTHRRALKPAAPSAEPRTWRTLVLLDLEAHPPRDAIQAITVRAEPTPARPAQFSLLDPALPSPERLAETMARLHSWTATGRGGTALLLDTHRPGAFAVGTFAPGPATPNAASAGPPRVALRAFRPPLPAEVAIRGGTPAFVSAAGLRGAVAAHAGPWRASGDWWDVAWSREEWDVALAASGPGAHGGEPHVIGGVYRIFRDRLREAWFVEGELD